MLGETNFKNLHPVWPVLSNVSRFLLVFGIAFKGNMDTKSTPSKSKEKRMVLLSFQKVGKTLQFSLLFEGVHFVCMFSVKVLVLFRQNANSSNSSRPARAKRTQGRASKVCKSLQFFMVFCQK